MEIAGRPIAKYEPIGVRGLVADWPAVRAGKDGPEALAEMLNFAATDERFRQSDPTAAFPKRSDMAVATILQLL